MVNLKTIKEHMDVLGLDGEYVGTVDRVDGKDSIKLTKNDPQAGGVHHLIPISLVDRVDESVHLNKNADEVRSIWEEAA